jgi:hypothetical protein
MIHVKSHRPGGWYAELDGYVLAWGNSADDALSRAWRRGYGHVAALIYPRSSCRNK